jgi:hypothetical protein
VIGGIGFDSRTPAVNVPPFQGAKTTTPAEAGVVECSKALELSA